MCRVLELKCARLTLPEVIRSRTEFLGVSKSRAAHLPNGGSELRQGAGNANKEYITGRKGYTNWLSVSFPFLAIKNTVPTHRRLDGYL